MANSTVARSTARMMERRHVTRSGMTRIGVLAAIGAAVWFSRPDTAGALAGSAFLGAVLFCDAVRARMRADRKDALTMWLAAMLSQLREYVVYLGLALGAVSAGIGGAWGWAAGALIALALRDSLLVARSAPSAPAPCRNMKQGAPSSQRRPDGFLGGLAPQPPREPRDSDPRLTGRLFGGGTRGTGHTGATNEADETGGSAGADGSHVVVRLPLLARRAMLFPQPARFLAIAVTATLWDARVVFLTLIVGCAVAVTGELVDPRSREGRR